MIGAWYDEDWVEHLGSWEELADVLRGDWERVDDEGLGLSLDRADGLLAFDLGERWRARHRRGLHRLGFRSLSHRAVWMWDVEPQLRSTDLSRFANPLAPMFEAPPSATRAAVVLRLRTSLARDHLIREQALRVLREVFRCETGDLRVLLAREDDGWGDDAWPLPGG